EKRSKIRVHADRVQFLDARRTDSSAGLSSGSDEEPGTVPQMARDPAMRRGSAAPTRGTGGGSSEPRGAANGPSRALSPAAGPLDHPRLADERVDDDLPF